MTCDQARELLPWFINGSLDEAEAREVERHLAGCEACRLELGETGATFAIFDQHLAPETLTAIAFDDAAPSPTEGAHLGECEICADRLAMARASRVELAAAEAEERALGEAGRPLPRDHLSVGELAVARAAPAPWRNLALAASLAAMVTATGWVWTWQSALRPSTMRGGEPASQGASERFEPLPNVSVVEIAPTLVGDSSGAAELPLEAPVVTLILRTWLDTGPELACRLTAEDGGVIWTLDGLVPRTDGTYALAVPTAELSPGLYRLVLLDGEGRDVESYALSFR